MDPHNNTRFLGDDSGDALGMIPFYFAYYSTPLLLYTRYLTRPFLGSSCHFSDRGIFYHRSLFSRIIDLSYNPKYISL